MPRKRYSKDSFGKEPLTAGNIGKHSPVTTLDKVERALTPLGQVKLDTGRTIQSFGYEDPFGTNATGLWGIPQAAAVFGGIWTGGTTASYEQPLVDFCNQVYNTLYVLAAGKGMSVTSFSLVTPANFGNYMSGYLGAYSGLRLLQSLTNIFGYNRACDAVAQNVLAFKPQIEGRLARLEGYPIPPSFKAAADKMCGVFVPSDNAVPPFFTGVTGAQNLDLTASASITSILTNIDTNITNMLGTAADLSNIIRLFAFLYGEPAPLGQKQIITDPQLYYLQLSQAWGYSDTTGATAWWAPSASSTVRDLPVYVWGKAETIDPLWFTLFRPALYANTANVALASVGQRGVFGANVSTPNGTTLNAYSSQGGVSSFNTSSAAGVSTITVTDFVDFEFLWAPIARTEVAVNSQISGDSRILPNWERYYVQYAEVIDETVKLYQKWFYGDMVR